MNLASTSEPWRARSRAIGCGAPWSRWTFLHGEAKIYFEFRPSSEPSRASM